MEKISKEEIIKIADNLFQGSDIIAKHGTSFANAMGIIEEGFYYSRTSMVSQKSKDPVQLCSYGWKESKRGEACNVIISIPKSFIKMLLNLDEEGYKKWKEKYLSVFDADTIIDATTKSVVKEVPKREGMPFLPPTFLKLVPKEFIKGFFVFCDNTNYIDFLSNKEEALNHLSYFDNPNYFDNLSKEEQEDFINNFNGKGKERSR